jgi:sec-independent protein translocase protein TatA
MGLTNPLHLMFVLVIALLVLGPKRLPEVARSVGHSVKAFRGSLTGADEPEPALAPDLQTIAASTSGTEA